jgi:hypothetical protein
MRSSTLYIFPGPGVGKNATRKEKNEAMKRVGEKMAANPSGVLMYHAPGRPFTLGKWLGVEFGKELLEAILVVFLLAQTGTASPVFTLPATCSSRSLAFACRNCCCAGVAKTHSCGLKGGN